MKTSPSRSSAPLRRRRRASADGRPCRRRPLLEVLEGRTLLSTFTVSSLSDDGPGSLRQAILDANVAAGVSSVISFDIPGSGVQTIQPRSALPAITAPVLIDGFSQPGYAGSPLIELNGSQAGVGDGLAITGSGVTVRGLDIHSFGRGAGILIAGAGATGNRVYGNVIGADPAGEQNEPNEYGIVLTGGAASNQIGSGGGAANSLQEANLIRGNVLAGVYIGTQTVGFAAGTAGETTPLTMNGNASIQNGSLQLTDGGGFEAGSVFTSTAVDVSHFSTEFDFQLTRGLGVGFTFTIQRQEPSALGGYFGLGYAGIQPSVAVKFDLKDDFGEGPNSTGLFTNGSYYQVSSVDLNGTGIDLHGGRVLHVAMTYDGATLSVTISDAAIGTSASQSYAVDIPGTVGGRTAYVGFTGSTDNFPQTPAVQTILGWNYRWSSQESAAGAANNQVQGNVITRNDGAGVVVVGADTVGNSVTADRIFGNTGQAIDLGDDGVTANGTAPRPGPNNLQNAPILFTTADGASHGLLHGGTPNTAYGIDVFASAGYGPGGAGEAAVYLGTLQVTTDDNGKALFDIPFLAPDDAPVLSATATDPQGNTSEISAARPASLQAPQGIVIVAPDQPLVLSGDSGNAVVLQDPSLAGTADADWAVTLTVTDGVLNLGTLDGLTGSGDGTGSLTYSGTLSAINAALATLTYTPSAGFKGNPSLTLSARSAQASQVDAQVKLLVADGHFAVTNTSDSGPGSLRQAILNSNAYPGPANTITFAIPGDGVHTIQPLSRLPEISRSVLLDGFSQPGYAGVPAIELNGRSLADSIDINVASDPSARYMPDCLSINASGVTVRGLAINGFLNPFASSFFSGSSAAINIQGADNWVYGNVLGTVPSGTHSKPNGVGIFVYGDRNRIGSNEDGTDDASEANLISGNAYGGVFIFDLYGEFQGVQNSVVGNLITGNRGPGVAVGNSTFSTGIVQNRISANRIFGNTGPSIDLVQDGVTFNTPYRRTGPNNQQNSPVVVTTADGGLQGWLYASEPDTTYQIEVFASAGFGPGGSGEAQEYLGAVQVTTDARGSARFSLPFTTPANLPIITATATDSQGNTSEFSVVRQSVLNAPGGVHFVSGRPVAVSDSGRAISIRDRDAGPLDPAWQVTISVPVGTLSFSTLAGLAGSGQGTGTLVYQGSLADIDAALAGLTYTPPPGDHIDAILTFDAISDGANPLHARVVLSDGLFAVTTTADSGPGSLRQAILDSNAAAGGRNTIQFAIPGTGLQTIVTSSPLPAVTNPVLIDGTTQAGFSGSPRIVLSGPSSGVRPSDDRRRGHPARRGGRRLHLRNDRDPGRIRTRVRAVPWGGAYLRRRGGPLQVRGRRRRATDRHRQRQGRDDAAPPAGRRRQRADAERRPVRRRRQ
ncbi:MAG: L-type lectin-domain containing protein [Isosphaeraceae bacterium]